MGDEGYRALLRRVALGLPLIAGPLVSNGCLLAPCPDPARETVVVTEMPDGGGTDCWAACPPSYAGKELVGCRADDAGVRWSCDYEVICYGGRRPEEPARGWLRGPDDEAARWLLHLAAAEAASVPAFYALADALHAHGAPPSLIDRACAAADDEVRHTQLVLRLAGFGELRIRVPRAETPSLEDLAQRNAIEGCVREAYASLEAAWQSEHATSAATRQVFATIARDEASHALLSHSIDLWIREKVDEAVTREARAEAKAELLATFESRPRPEGLGLPDPSQARALLALAA
ncbi:MAG: hypothetical protein KC619_03480 [Myxococcales bacterium]|nr:hypothetical protein [Myxococcales bacterium]